MVSIKTLKRTGTCAAMFDPLAIDRGRETPDIGPVRMPSPLTPLLGRQGEVDELVSMLRQGEVRLVTVTGQGGVGKTRLAIEVASRLRQDFPGGQFFIPLNRLHDPDDVVPAIVDVIRHHCAPAATTLTDIVDSLGDARLLLLLNAADGLVAARTSLIQMLEHMPMVTALVTSRVPFRVRGEQEYPIACLPLPHPAMSLQELREVPSVQLFLQRARSVRPAFDLTEQNRDDIIEVLNRLDGLPVAVELAALRSRLFPVGAIRERLDSLLDMLVGGPHDLPERLRSIRAVIRWGYDLLSEREQRSLRALSVFENAFSFEAAAGVLVDAEGRPLSTGEVIDSLTQLVDHSTVVQVPVEGTQAGYRMPVTTRDFARELLVEHGEHEDARGRELAFYLTQFRRSAAAVYGPQQPELLARVDYFSGNLHHALRVARRDRAHVDDALRLATHLAAYWLLRGILEEGADLLQAFLDLAQDVSDRERADACRQLGSLNVEMNRLDKARAYHANALSLYERLGHQEGMADSWNNLGVVAMRMGDVDEARDLLTRAHEARKEGENRGALAQVLSDLGDLALHEGDAALAVQRHEAAYHIHVDLRNRLSIVCDCVNLLTGALLRDEPQAREDWYVLGVRFAEDINDRQGKAQLDLAHGMLELRAGEVTTGLAAISAALEGIGASGSARLMLEALPLMAEVAVRLGDDRLAAQLFGAASHMGFGTERFAWYRGKRQVRQLERDVRRRLGQGEFTRFEMLGSHQSIAQTIRAVQDLTLQAIREGAGRDEEEVAEPAPVIQLTNREREVLELVAQGLSDRAIADDLGISPRTAMTHVSNIIKKMKVHSRSAASEYGIRMGLVPPPRDGA